MLLQVLSTEDERTFRLVGELELTTAHQLQAALATELVSAGDLTLDLSELTFLDSTGLRALITVARGLDERGRLILVSPGRMTSKVLDIAGLSRLPNVEVCNEAEGLPSRDEVLPRRSLRALPDPPLPGAESS